MKYIKLVLFVFVVFVMSFSVTYAQQTSNGAVNKNTDAQNPPTTRPFEKDTPNYIGPPTTPPSDKNSFSRQPGYLDEREQTHEERMEQRQGLCAQRAERVYQRVLQYQQNKEQHRILYQTASVKVNNVVDGLKNKGYDTASLEASLTKANNLVDEAQELHSLFIAQLSDNSENASCDDIEGAREYLEEAHTTLAQLNDVRSQIRSIYNDEIKPELLRLRQELASNTQDEQIEPVNN